MRRRHPPYAAELVGKPLDAGDVFVCTGWDLAKGRRRIVVPHDLRPDVLDLTFLRGRSVVLCHRSTDAEEQLVSLVRAIIRVRPVRLILLDVDRGAATFIVAGNPERRAA